MSRWGKNIVVPLDSLCKEKENTNRPTVARSVGTVGKWGKMGFTSTRTYSLTALPPAVAAAAAAAATAASAGESPASLLDDDLSPSVPEPPKPKKFFKSRNTAPPEVIAQMIQQLPRLSTSPVRDLGPSTMAAPPSVLGTPTHSRDAIKLKIPKSNSAERKKKSSPKKSAAATKAAPATSEAEEAAATAPPKPAPDTPAKPGKKKKEEKKLKPEAPPSRIIARARKTVNYAEYDDDDRMPTPVKDLVAPKTKLAEEPPPPENAASKTPEHPPIVLRISKGTSRLVSTDSDEQALPNSAALPTHYSPLQNDLEPEHAAGAVGDFEATAGGSTPKIIVKPPRPPSPEPALPEPLQSQPSTDLLLNAGSYSSEINYSTVKISPDKPPKERLKLIIKGDVIRNAIAAAAAAEAAKAAAKTPEHSAGGGNPAADGVRPEKEKKTKSKKHKHAKHDVPPGGNQLRPTTVAAATACGEFKTPSPHLALGGSGAVACHTADTALNDRTIISPPALSERDFDSQSSVLGSISSKGNSTPHLAPAANEESCVVHSRGSSVITSDLETSQHSSLVAPPSDIESRLESMMMDDEVTQRPLTLATQEPLQEDILAVLQGDESRQAPETAKVNGGSPAVADGAQEANGSSRRVTRGRNRGAKTVNYTDEPEEPAKATRTRGKKQAAATPVVAALEEPAVPKRTRGRGAKKAEEETPMETGAAAANGPEASAAGDSQALASAEPCAEDAEGLAKQVAAPRRGRLARNVGNNNNLNNNNINKIAANLSAKAGAAVEALSATPVEAAAAVAVTATPAKAEPAPTAAAATTQPRIYGRKRKNQQVMHLVPTASDEPDEEPEPARKVANLQDETDANMLGSSAAFSGERGDYENGPHPAQEHHATTTTRAPSVTPSSPPPQRDYKVKDKFKRTLTLDNQANNCNAMVVATSSAAAAAAVTHDSKLCDPEEQQRDPVKLLISKKKGSIFKSRALPVQSEQAPSAKRHLYKHRWDAEANGGISNEASATPASANDAPAPSAAADNIFDDEAGAAAGVMRDNSSPTLGKLTRVVKPNPQVYANPFDMDEEMGGGEPETITSVKVDRKAKDFYTVVRNVKTAHQIQEIGEYQEMDDDAEYILDALQPHNPIPTRCLSALQLATKCMTAAFRMHVRAHGVVAKFFKALADANGDLSLGLCTSAIMYILSQEGLNMDLDRDSLELMMNLLECETKATPSDRANYERNRQKVRELCEEMKAQGKAIHLNMDSITVGTLAMETLLSLTSKRAGEWFKDELRELGGLEHIIKTISDCCRPIMAANAPEGVAWNQSLIDNTQTVERCMRVLENVTQMNEENQKYMLTYAQGAAIETLCTLFALCDRELRLHPTTEASARDNPGVVVRELLIPLMKVLTNLTHTFNPAQSTGAAMLGKRTAVIETSFNLLMQTTQYIPDRNVFELSMLSLLLLINLTMHTMQNRTIVMNSYAPSAGGNQHNDQHGKVTAVQAIMDYFYKCEELAKLVEKNTDAYLDNTEKNKKKQEEVDETVNNLLQKAGHHMEHTLKGSYAGILVGHLITDSEEYESIVRTHLRGNGFKEIIAVLEKYHTFMNLTASSEATVVAHIKSTKKLIDYFKKRDLLHEMNDSNDCGHPLNLEKHNSHNSDDESGGKELGGPSQRVYKTYSQR